MSLKKTPLVLTLFFSLAAEASPITMGTASSGGGNAVVCRDPGTQKITSVELLDYWSFNREQDLKNLQTKRPKSQLDLGPSNDEMDQLLYVLNRLENVDASRAQLYRNKIEKAAFSKNFFMFDPTETGVRLGEVRDYTVAGQPLNQNCRFERFAVQGSRYNEILQAPFLIDTTYFDFSGKKTNLHRAGIILHELAYEEARSQGLDHSDDVRDFVAFISSDEMNGISKRAYLDKLELLEMTPWPLSTTQQFGFTFLNQGLELDEKGRVKAGFLAKRSKLYVEELDDHVELAEGLLERNFFHCMKCEKVKFNTDTGKVLSAVLAPEQTFKMGNIQVGTGDRIATSISFTKGGQFEKITTLIDYDLEFSGCTHLETSYKHCNLGEVTPQAALLVNDKVWIEGYKYPSNQLVTRPVGDWTFEVLGQNVRFKSGTFKMAENGNPIQGVILDPLTIKVGAAEWTVLPGGYVKLDENTGEIREISYPSKFTGLKIAGKKIKLPEDTWHPLIERDVLNFRLPCSSKPVFLSLNGERTPYFGTELKIHSKTGKVIFGFTEGGSFSFGHMRQVWYDKDGNEIRSRLIQETIEKLNFGICPTEENAKLWR